MGFWKFKFNVFFNARDQLLVNFLRDSNSNTVLLLFCSHNYIINLSVKVDENQLDETSPKEASPPP